MSPLIRRRSGPHSNCAKRSPLDKFRSTCCAIAMESRSGLHPARGGREHTGGTLGAALALAASLRGARDWYDSPRVPGPRDRLQRSCALPACEVVPGVLSRNPDAPLVGERRAGTAARAPARGRASGCDPASGRPSPPVRAARSLSTQASFRSCLGTFAPNSRAPTRHEPFRSSISAWIGRAPPFRPKGGTRISCWRPYAPALPAADRICDRHSIFRVPVSY